MAQKTQAFPRKTNKWSRINEYYEHFIRIISLLMSEYLLINKHLT